LCGDPERRPDGGDRYPLVGVAGPEPGRPQGAVRHRRTAGEQRPHCDGRPERGLVPAHQGKDAVRDRSRRAQAAGELLPPGAIHNPPALRRGRHQPVPAEVAGAASGNRHEAQVADGLRVEPESGVSVYPSPLQDVGLLGRQGPTAENQLGRLDGGQAAEGRLEGGLVNSIAKVAHFVPPFSRPIRLPHDCEYTDSALGVQWFFSIDPSESIDAVFYGLSKLRRRKARPSWWEGCQWLATAIWPSLQSGLRSS